MTNQQNDSDTPATDSKAQSPSQAPMLPTAPQEGQMSEESKDNSNDNKNVSKELAREFRWVEFAQIASNVVLAVVGIFALCIYKGQLTEMRNTSEATKIAADAAKDSADLTRKQLQAVSAAKVEMYNGVQINPTVPPFGQVNVGLINNGHAICQQAVVTLSLTLKGSNQKTQRMIFSNKIEKRSMIYPGTQPDGILIAYVLTKEEWDRVQKTQAYLVVDSVLEYDDGFQRQVVQDDCTAFLWGDQRFGRVTTKCAEVPTYLKMAKSLVKN